MALPIVAPAPVWSLGDKLAKSRRCAGLEQADMAQTLHVSRALISKWERDITEPTVTQARMWAEATGVSLEWLSVSGYNSLTGVPMRDGEQGELIDRALETPYNAVPDFAVAV